MQIEFKEKEQDWKNGVTRYWFTVDGEEYCIADSEGDQQLLDSEGFPIEELNDHAGIKAALLPECEKRIDD